MTSDSPSDLNCATAAERIRLTGDVSALCLLDLTAAFDTVDHDLLMLRLERQFGLRGVVLQWSVV